MRGQTRIADYFFVASVQIDSNNLEGENPNPVVLDRFPGEDYEDVPFTENAEFFCLPEGACIEHREIERRKPYIFTFCFTQSDGSQSYGTSLVFYEKLKLNGQICYNKYNQELYIPKALCILSLKPFFSCHISFLKCLFKKAVCNPETEEDDISIKQQTLSRSDSIRKEFSLFASRSGSLSMASIEEDFRPIEFDIRYYIEILPYIQSGMNLQIPLFHHQLSLVIPPSTCLPFCDYLCLHSLFSCLSIEHIQVVLSTLLLDGKVVLHSQNKYQLTLCSTAILSLLKPVLYTLTFIPLLPPQLIDYIEAPTPFLIGISTDTFSLHSQEQELECLLVHLDFDRLTFPEGMTPITYPLTNDPSFELTSPLDYQVLWEEKDTQSALIRLSIGPGMLGLFLKQEPRQLVYSSPGVPALFEEVVYIDSEKSIPLNGCVSHVLNTIPYLDKNPAIIELNQTQLVGIPLKQVTILLASSPRPLTLLLQVGVRKNLPSIPSSVSECSEELSCYYEEMRVKFFLFFVEFFRFYEDYLKTNEAFTTNGFVSSIPEDYQPFVSKFVNTQLYEGLMQVYDKLREDPNAEVDEETKSLILLIKECVVLSREEGGIEKIHSKLHPRNWNLKVVELPSVDSCFSEEALDRLIDRDGRVFPRLDKSVFGNPVKRIEV